MNFKELSTWVEAHPGESVLIGGVSLIAILWLLGYFSPSAAAPAQDPLAAAYYAAEAQQAVVGGQIQQATIAAASQTAVAGIQANAAVAINNANTNAATTINGQNTGAATTINQSLGQDALLATQSNNATSLATTQSNNAMIQQVNDSNNLTTQFAGIVNGIISPEIAAGQYPSASQVFTLPGGQTVGLDPFDLVNISALKSVYGYTPEQIQSVWGIPAPASTSK